MSGGEDGFLSRWSRLKREQAGQDKAAATDDGPAPGAPAGGPEAASPADGVAGAEPGRSLQELIDTLPSVEDLVPGQDISAFMQAWVPSDLRHAALRRMWLVDPAIRDYVSPALDYAYDYNNPSSIAGFGSMQTTAEQIREVMAMFDRAVGTERAGGEAEGSTKVVERLPHGDGAGTAATGSDVALQQGAPAETGAVSGPDQAPSAKAGGSGVSGVPGTDRSRARDVAAQEKSATEAGTSLARRRHGGALPG